MLNLSTMSNNSENNNSILEQNCRPEWPTWTCILANVCGLLSTTLWFIVLLPQVLKNFRRKSVEGLSILWATANFTASLINIFFVYLYADIPLYGKINTVYMPILEFTILVQFWIYGYNYSRKMKVGYAVSCFLIWGSIITINLTLKLYSEIQWIAIALWCVETFPQVILNFKIHSTSGQSTRSVVIALTGKMSDFIATYGLVLPLQYVIMIYFSSSVAYVNGMQVVWYYRRGQKPSRHNDESINYVIVENEADDNFTDESQADDSQMNAPRQTLSQLSTTRLFILSFMFTILCVFAYCLKWATGSFVSLIAPFSIILIVVSAMLYYNREPFLSFKGRCRSVEE